MNALSRSWMIICIVVLVAALSSCAPTPLVSPTISPAPLTNTPSPSLTPTLPSPQVNFEKPSAVEMVNPKDPSLPEWIISGENGFQLSPEWQAAEIQYTYEMWVVEEEGSQLATRSGLGYEIIQKKGAGYVWNQRNISPAKVKAFLATLTNLHPAQSLLIGIFHTDDYPVWQLDLTGADGSHILLYSASDENPGYGPWHVIYNGRIYVEYEGAIGLAIGNLFEGMDDSFNWNADGIDSDYHPANLVGFNTSGLPPQLSSGFTGLLPIASMFEYKTSLAEGEIRGYVRGKRLIQTSDGFGRMEDLKLVELMDGAEKKACTIEDEPKEQDDPDARGADWKFVCKPTSIHSGERYHYPIRLEFSWDAGSKLIAAGELQGIWRDQAAPLIFPPAEEIQAALKENPDLQELLKDHLLDADYTGKMQLGQDKSPMLLGNILLQGQANINAYKVPYTIAIPFSIAGRKFVDWKFSRKDLERFLVDVFKSPLSLRIYRELPETRLMLRYIPWIDGNKLPVMPHFKGVRNPYLGLSSLDVCSRKVREPFPTLEEPLRAFAFSELPDFSFGTAFIVMNDVLIPYSINLYPRAGFDKTNLYLTPKELNSNGKIPFLQIYLYPDDRFPVELHLQSSAKDRELVNSLVSVLPFQVDADETEFTDYFDVKNVKLVIDEDGRLSLASCFAK